MINNDSISIESAAPNTGYARTSRIKEWTRILSGFLAAQGGIQILAAMSGLLLVNFMPVREYALYTLGLSAFSFLAIVSDLGISNALSYFKREAAAAQTSFEPYVSSALHLRRTLFGVSVLFLVVLLPVVGVRRGFGILEICLVAAFIALSAWFQIRASVQLMMLRLEGQYGRSYTSELFGTGGRLFLSGGLIALGLVSGWLMVLVNAIGSIATAVFSWRPISLANAQVGARRNIWRYMLPTLPNALYFSIQGPLVIWLCAYFGKTENIAQVGALGRLGLLIGLVTNFIGMIIIPRLAVVTNERWYLKRYVQYWIPLLAIGVAIVLAGFTAPGVFLFFLGKNYRNLQNEFAVVAISVALKLFETYLVTINSARGWNRWQAVALIFYVAGQAVLIVGLDLSTTTGILLFGLFSNLIGLLLQVPTNIIGFIRPDWVKVKMLRVAQMPGSDS